MDEMARCVDVGADMDAGAHVRNVVERAFIHGFELFKLNLRITRPDGESWRNAERNIVDGHEKLLYTGRVEESRSVEQLSGVWMTLRSAQIFTA
jgi:hypothetical protein